MVSILQFTKAATPATTVTCAPVFVGSSSLSQISTAPGEPEDERMRTVTCVTLSAVTTAPFASSAVTTGAGVMGWFTTPDEG